MQMLRKVVLLVFAVFLISANVALAESQGNPYFPVMPKYTILEAESFNRDFDQHTFKVSNGTIRQEGKKYYSIYNPKEDVTPYSALQIIRNHTNAAISMGGKVLLDVDEYHNRTTTMTLKRNNKDLWVEVVAHHAGEWYTITIIEIASTK